MSKILRYEGSSQLPTNAICVSDDDSEDDDRNTPDFEDLNLGSKRDYLYREITVATMNAKTSGSCIISMDGEQVREAQGEQTKRTASPAPRGYKSQPLKPFETVEGLAMSAFLQGFSMSARPTALRQHEEVHDSHQPPVAAALHVEPPQRDRAQANTASRDIDLTYRHAKVEPEQRR